MDPAGRGGAALRRTLLATSLGTLSAAVVGVLGTDPESSWYRSLARAPCQPPPVAFLLVWTPLSALIAWGTARMVDAEPDPAPADGSEPWLPPTSRQTPADPAPQRDARAAAGWPRTPRRGASPPP